MLSFFGVIFCTDTHNVNRNRNRIKFIFFENEIQNGKYFSKIKKIKKKAQTKQWKLILQE